MSVTTTDQVTIKDAKGRTITVKQMSAVQRLDFFEACGANVSNPAWLGMASMAASVSSIGGVPQPFPTNRVQIRAIVERLGDEGMDAVRAHMMAAADEEAGGEAPDAEAELKATAGN